MMSRLHWATYYSERNPPLWRWSHMGMTSGANLWAHYIFATRPTKRQLRRARKGKGEVRIQLHSF